MRSCSLHGCSRSVRLSSPVTGTVATRISPGSRSNPVDKVMGTVSRNSHCSSSLHTSERRENGADVALTTLGGTKRSREQRSVHFRIRSVITIWSHSTVTALTLIRSCSDSRSAISILLRIPHSAFLIPHSACFIHARQGSQPLQSNGSVTDSLACATHPVMGAR